MRIYRHVSEASLRKLTAEIDDLERKALEYATVVV